MDEHDDDDVMDIKQECDDSRKRKRYGESVGGPYVCQCLEVQCLKDPPLAYYAHGLYLQTILIMESVFASLPSPGETSIDKLREENPKYDKFFQGIFKGIAKFLWRLNDKRLFTPTGCCSRGNEGYRKQLQDFVSDFSKFGPELKTVEGIDRTIDYIRLNFDKYPLLMWEEYISRSLLAVKVHHSHSWGLDKVADVLCGKCDVPPSAFARADLDVAKDIIADVPPLTVDQRTHILLNLLCPLPDNPLDVLILDAFQEMKFVSLYEKFTPKELRKIFPRCSVSHFIEKNDINSRIRRIFSSTMWSICLKLKIQNERALCLNWFEIPFSDSVLELMQNADLRRRSEDERFIMKKHIIWAFERSNMLDFLPETGSLTKARGEKCAKHPPYDVYAYSCKLAKLLGADEVQFEHLALAVNYGSSIDQNPEVINEIVEDAAVKKFIEDANGKTRWNEFVLWSCKENVGVYLHDFFGENIPLLSATELTEKVAKDNWLIDVALSDLTSSMEC